MRVGLGLLAVALGSIDANAHPVEGTASSTEVDAPALMLEAAGTWSGQTAEPKTGWRAALLAPVDSAAISSGPEAAVHVAFVARFDDHGAPAEPGTPELLARSWGAGLRAMTTWASSQFRFGVFAEGTVGRTRARNADEMTSRGAGHWMASAGLVGGTRTLQLVADFGWMVTDADHRIGPIASLGLHLAID
ncbi:MAG: hypothetical protein H0T89_09825 [Deltaproteobacteria bacterium]|nr:hypothetical protein [Deltaproteobacteria bacterium]MDQ3301156.1 hypothetical protein [Myxococcota bacterium]